jgi:hypothetical protein
MKRLNCIFCLLLLTIFSAAQGYNIFEDHGKVGLKNEEGKVIIPARYEALGWSNGAFSVLNNVTGYRSGGRWGLISLNNHLVTKAEFEELSPAESTLLIARKKSNLSLRMVSGVINASGREVIPFQYDNIRLSSLRAIVFTRIGNEYKYGLIDMENKILIPQEFKSIRSIGSLRYAVENFQDKIALYTEAGKPLTGFTIDSISAYKKNFAIVYQGLYQGLVDREGAVRVEPKHREVKVDDNGSIYTRDIPTWLLLDGGNKLGQKLKADSVAGIRKNLLKLNTSGVIELTDAQLKRVAAPNISSLGDFKKGKAIFSSGGKYGLIRTDGIVIIEPKYSALFSDNAFFVSNIKQGGKDNWTLLDSTGRALHAKTYERILPFNGLVFPVINRRFWGAINTEGKEIISCTYDSLVQQHGENMVVKFHGEYGIINQRETWLVPPKSNKLRLVAKDRFIEITPKTTYLKSFDNSIIYFSENRLELKGNNLLEYLPSGTVWEIGMNGIILNRQIMPELVEKVFPETEGLRGIKKNGQYGFIDSQGRLRIANRYDDIRPFSDQRAAMKIRGKWGFIGHDDKIAVQPTYDEVFDFTFGLAVVKTKGFLGVIDTSGKQLLQPRYENIWVLPHGNVIIQQNKLLGLANRQGQTLINPKYHQLKDLNNGYIIVERDGKYGAITVQGISTIPLIYDYISYDPSNNIFFAMIKSEWTTVKF